MLEEVRRRGREPSETNAPGPRSSLKDERERRWGLGRMGAVVIVVEEDGSAGTAYGMVRDRWSWTAERMCGACEGEYEKRQRQR